MRTNVNVKEVERPNYKQDHPPLNITLDDGTTITAQELLVAIGRTPNTDKIRLETIGLTPGDIVESLLSNVLLSGRLVNPHAFNTFLLYG